MNLKILFRIINENIVIFYILMYNIILYKVKKHYLFYKIIILLFKSIINK